MMHDITVEVSARCSASVVVFRKFDGHIFRFEGRECLFLNDMHISVIHADGSPMASTAYKTHSMQ